MKIQAMNSDMSDVDIIREVKAQLLADNTVHGDMIPSDEKLKEIIKSTRRQK